MSKYSKTAMDNYKVEYLIGYMAAGNGIPFDENQSNAWKDGWNDSYEGMYGDDDLDEEV